MRSEAAITEHCLKMTATDSERQHSGVVMTHVAHRCRVMRRVCQRRGTLRRRRKIRTKNNTAVSDVCISSSRTTTDSASSSSSSSASQIVDAQCSQPTRRKTTRFFVEDILRPDFGVRHATWRPSDHVRMDTSSCSLSTDEQHSTSSSSSSSSASSSSSSMSSAAALTTSNCNCPVQLTTTTSMSSATLYDNTTRHKTAAMDSDSTSLNADMLPAWIFCTRYSDRPSSGMLDNLSFVRVRRSA